jgi:putative ABC transport system ATP-binding protein
MKNLNEKQDVSIMMVTHDPYSASYCQRILFIQDGELYKRNSS